MDYYLDIEAFCDFVTENNGGDVEEKLIETTTSANGSITIKETIKKTP